MGCCLPCFRARSYSKIPERENEINSNRVSSRGFSTGNGERGGGGSGSGGGGGMGVDIQMSSTSGQPQETREKVSRGSVGIDTSDIDTLNDFNMHNVLGEHEGESQFDSESPVFVGVSLEQKFTNKSAYEPRFVWVNLQSRTMHLSIYMTKDKRHKEASVSDVTDIVAGPPSKAKKISDATAATCLTVNFKRGGYLVRSA